MRLTEFLEPFYPNEQEPIWLLGFPSKNLPEDHPDRAGKFKRSVTRQTLASNKFLQDNLRHQNQTMGLYFVVNAGGTEKSDIKRINAVYCEIDDIPLADQHALYDSCELKPNIRVETKKSVHAYWLPSEIMSLKQFTQLQNGLITRFKGDPKIKNENRVMRLPYFKHVSFDSEYIYKQVVIHTFKPERRASFEELLNTFPYTPPPEPKYAAEGYIGDTMEGISNELRFRISQHPSYHIESNRTWATAKGVCHDGKNNTALTVNLRTGAVSCKAGCSFDRILNSFGLSKPLNLTGAGIIRVPRRKQSSELYQHLVEYKRDYVH